MSAIETERGRSREPSPAAQPVVRLEDVGRRYEVGGTSVVALEDVTLDVEPGEFIVVLAPRAAARRRC